MFDHVNMLYGTFKHDILIGFVFSQYVFHVVDDIRVEGPNFDVLLTHICKLEVNLRMDSSNIKRLNEKGTLVVSIPLTTSTYVRHCHTCMRDNRTMF